MNREKVSALRFTVEEYEMLRRMAWESGCRDRKGNANVSMYIRNILFAGGSRKDLKKELHELNFQIRKIGVNINQAAKRLNSGVVLPGDQSYLLAELSAVEKLLKDYKKMAE